MDALLRTRYDQIYSAVAGRSVLLATPTGRVIADSDGQLDGRRLPRGALEEGIPIEWQGRTVGVLLVGPVVDNFSPRESGFLRAVRTSAAAIGGAGIALAVLFGFLLLRQVTTPLRALIAQVRSLRQGRFGGRVEVPTRARDELGTLAEAFNELSAHLQRSEELRRRLMNDIAHELRTPLTVIRCQLEAMVAGVLPPRPQQLATLYDQALLLSRLVADLEELALAEAGELPLHRRPQDLGELLERIGLAVRPQLAERGIRLVVRIQRPLRLVDIDEKRIEQVLLNLLANAQRYTPPGGEIRLRLEPGRDEVRLSVADTGCGIPSEDLPYVFQRFYRGDRSRSRATGGSGLGLAIAKQLIEAHGGRIWVESAPARGTTFHVELPASAAPRLCSPVVSEAQDSQYEAKREAEATAPRTP